MAHGVLIIKPVILHPHGPNWIGDGGEIEPWHCSQWEEQPS